MEHVTGNSTFFIFSFILALISYSGHAQNLVPNCSFEDYTTCPTNSGQINFCREWYTPGEGTPDYCNQCNSTNYSVPNNLWGNQNAKDEWAYAHLICYYPSQPQYREYIQVKLAGPLRSGESYTVSFYISCSDQSRYAIDGMGLFFSTEPLDQPGKQVIDLPEDPHISNTVGYTLRDKDDWVQISGSFVANGEERYLTIGNFIADNDLSIHSFTTPGLNIASYYIDQVKVEPTISWLDLGPDTVLCPEEIYTLDATIPGNASYKWDDGSNEAQLSVSQAGTYWVEVDFGCWPIYDQVVVEYYEDPYPFLANDTAICPGNQIIIDAGSQYSSYYWQDGIELQSYTAEEEGLYWVDVTNTGGCTFRDSVNIVPINTPEFNLGMDTTLCLGTSITLDPDIPGPYVEYLWSDQSIEPKVTVSDSGNYWLLASNPCGEYSDTVYLEYINCSPEMFVPSAFTPNGDLKNDLFQAKGINIGQYRMLIYDRWGSLIFESNSMDLGWDGTNKGEPCPTGVYVWIISYESITNKEEVFSETLKGTCLLLR